MHTKIIVLPLDFSTTSTASKDVTGNGNEFEKVRAVSKTSLNSTAIPPPLLDRGKERSLYPGGVSCLILGSCPEGRSQVSVKKTKSSPKSKMKSDIPSVLWSGQADFALNKQEEKKFDSLSPVDEGESERSSQLGNSTDLDEAGVEGSEVDAKGNVGDEGRVVVGDVDGSEVVVVGGDEDGVIGVDGDEEVVVKESGSDEGIVGDCRNKDGVVVVVVVDEGVVVGDGGDEGEGVSGEGRGAFKALRA